jgi:hypothetical protein
MALAMRSLSAFSARTPALPTGTYSKDAFVGEAQGFLASESLQRLDVKGEVSACQGTLCTGISGTPPFKVLALESNPIDPRL